MKLIALSLTAFLATLPLHARIDRTVEKTFTITTSGTLRLETNGGDIKVQPGADGVVKIVAHEHIKASSDAEADELLKDLELGFEQTGADVHAWSKYDRGVAKHRWGSTPVEVDFVATVPAQFAAEVSTSGGDVEIGDLVGAVKARTSGGDVRLGKLGNQVEAHTSGGDITLSQAHGQTKLSTSGGDIHVGRVAGPAEVGTSGGDITIDSVEQCVSAKTSGGDIKATIVGPLKADSVLSTSGGEVKVTVDKTAAFHLDAATSGGGVDADGLSITLESGKRGRDKLVGNVNGGGAQLKLRSSGGGLSIKVR